MAPARLASLTLVVSLGAGALAASLPPAVADPDPPPRDTRPNVVLVVVDDMGWGDPGGDVLTGGHPHPWHQTPALDRLGREGTVLTDAYAGTSCAPTRMALLTGAAPQRDVNRVYGARRFDGGGRGRAPLLRGVSHGDGSGQSALQPGTVTVPERLAAAGYRTTHVGKFDVTRDAAAITADHGYETNVGGTAAGSPLAYHAAPGQGGPEFDPRIGPELDAYAADYTAEYVAAAVEPYSVGVEPAVLDALVGTPKHLSDAVGDAALASIDAVAADPRPFFTAVNHYAVHAPVGPASARADLWEKWSGLVPPTAVGAVPAYAAMLEGVDQTVARIVDRLEQTQDPRNPGHPLSESTVLVVTSDNGGRVASSEEAQVGSNGPLRGEKFQLWEGGVRVPLVAWSGDRTRVRSGARNPSVVQTTDLSATLLALAEAPADERTAVDGRDLTGLLVTGELLTDPVLHHQPGYFLEGRRTQRPASALRQGRWKVIYDYESGRIRLHDLSEDPGETRNLARRQRERTDLMVRALVDELAATGSDLAVLRDGRGPVEVPIVPGTLTYADGRVVEHAEAGTLLVSDGQEMPLVHRPPVPADPPVPPDGVG